MPVMPLRNLSLENEAEVCAGAETGQELSTPSTNDSAWATYSIPIVGIKCQCVSNFSVDG